MGRFKLTKENYYTPEANRHFIDYSLYKEFVGLHGCECRGLAIAKGEWVRPKTKALLVGSFTDAYFEGTLKQWILDNPECFRRDRELKAEFRQAIAMIKRAIREPLFNDFMAGDKQAMLTAKIAGVPIRVKMDVFNGERIVDIKTTASLSRVYYAADTGERMSFVEYFNYAAQAAFYTEAVRQNFGKVLPYYLAVITKEKEDGVPHPRVAIIRIPPETIKEKLTEIEYKLPKVWSIVRGRVKPVPCGTCPWCADNLPLDSIIDSDQILMEA